jgi:hypothetical protein
MELTATRCALTFSLIRMCSLRSTLALGAVAHLVLVRRMRAKPLTSIVVAALLLGCGTVGEVPLIKGVSPQDVAELDRVVRTEKHAHKVYEYSYHQDGGWILLQTDVGAYSARRVRGKWVLTPVVIVG